MMLLLLRRALRSPAAYSRSVSTSRSQLKEHLNNHMILKLMFTDLFLETGQHRHRGIHRVNTITHMAGSVPEASGEVDSVRYAIELVPGVGNVIVHRKK